MKWKINEKNYASVMDKVNRFLQKSTVEYLGIVPTVVGEEKVDLGGIKLTVPKYEDLPKSVPYLNGSCYVHPMWGEPANPYNKGYKKPILAISSNLDNYCLPLQEGSSIEINSTRMVVTVIDTNLGLAPSVHTFINMPLTEEAIVGRQLDRLKSRYSDYIYDCDFEFDDDYDGFINKSILRDLVDMFINHAYEAIDEVNDGIARFTITNEMILDEIEHCPVNTLETPIQCEIDFRDFAKNGNYDDTYVVNGEKKLNMVSVCYALLWQLFEPEERDFEEEYFDGTDWD